MKRRHLGYPMICLVPTHNFCRSKIVYIYGLYMILQVPDFFGEFATPYNFLTATFMIFIAEGQ
jgi:hypothetical protein